MHRCLNQLLIRSLVQSITVVGAVLAYAKPTGAGEPEEKWKHLEIRSGRPRPPFMDVHHGDSMYDSWFGNMRKDADGQPTAYAMKISHVFLGVRRKNESYGTVGYPPLRKGDLVPVYNNVYVATELRDGPGKWEQGGHQIEMKWVPNDKLPAGVALGKESLLFPLGGKSGGGVVPLVGNTIVDFYAITPKSIDAPVADRPDIKAKPSAKIEIEYHHKLTKTGSEYQAVVQKGDALLIGARYFKVRNVVPRDPKTKVIGWIELAPESTSKEELVRDKVRLVDPEPLKH